MRFTMSTGSMFNSSVERAFECAKEAGYDGVELMLTSALHVQKPEFFQTLSRTFELPICSVHPLVRKFDVRKLTPENLQPGGGMAQEGLKDLHQALSIAAEVGARVVVAHLPFRLEDGALFRLIDGRTTLSKMYKGVKIAVENMGAAGSETGSPFKVFGLNVYAGNSPEFLATISDVTFDTTHAGTLGWDIVKFVDTVPGIAHVHFSDYDGRTHRLPGHGSLPLREMLQRLKSVKFTGDVVLEVKDDTLVPSPVSALRQALDYMRETVV